MTLYNKQYLSQVLRQLRGCGTEHEISQRELARRVGCSFASVQNWEDSSKTIVPDEYNLQKLAAYAGWDVDDLKRRLKGRPPINQLSLQQILGWVRTCEQHEAIEVIQAAAQKLAENKDVAAPLFHYDLSEAEPVLHQQLQRTYGNGLS
ncbi:MAG TPA: helix-turn-helix transcriptional regulator [Candidatus Caenarcaniphilales bacterium]